MRYVLHLHAHVAVCRKAITCRHEGQDIMSSSESKDLERSTALLLLLRRSMGPGGHMLKVSLREGSIKNL